MGVHKLASNRERVLILYKYLPQWRRDFFERLRASLGEQGVDLSLGYGKLRNSDASKADEVDLEWAAFRSNRVFRLGGRELYWQPFLGESGGYDLVIVEQANKLLINYALQFLSAFGRRRIAFWGHGIDRKKDAHSPGNRFKRLSCRLCDWWFAYTLSVKSLLVEWGFPEERITVVANSIDTVALQQSASRLENDELHDLKTELGLKSNEVGIFCGGMYAHKDFPFLLAACDEIKNRVPGFEMLFLGAGPDEGIIGNAAARRPWLHYIGPVFGSDRAAYFRLARVLLVPKAVGLVILDSFATETPLLTTTARGHGPEIEYLRDSINGLSVRPLVSEYAEGCSKLLRDDTELQRLRQGCRESARLYTLENMVDHFSDGVLKALGRHGS